jgi:hypothetical protein
MSGFRLPAPQGIWVDRSRPLQFSFNGRELQGYAGDTVASALLQRSLVDGESDPSPLLAIGVVAMLRARSGRWREASPDARVGPIQGGRWAESAAPAPQPSCRPTGNGLWGRAP